MRTGNTSASTGECEAGSGGALTFGTYSATASLDPTRVSGGGSSGGTELAAFYDTLTVFDAASGEYQPRVAESLEPNDDLTEWTLSLPAGLTYPNGDPFDAENVQAHLARFDSDASVSNLKGLLLSSVAETRVVDPQTLVFELNAPWASFPYLLASEPGMVVNTRVIGADEDAFGANPPAAAGVGPFEVANYAIGEELVMQPRADYWGGAVCLEQLRFVFVEGDQATYDALRAGDVDAAFVSAPDVYAAAREEGYESITEWQEQPSNILFNHSDGRPTADLRVRQAITHAIDENVMNERAYGGAGRTGRAMVSPDFELYSPDMIEQPYDPARATELLEEAKAAGFSGELELMCSDSSPTPEWALAVEAMLEAVGFDIEVSLMPVAPRVERLGAHDYDIACFGNPFSLADVDSVLFRTLYSESATNRLAYSNPEMDALLLELNGAVDLTERSRVLTEINQIWVEDAIGFAWISRENGVLLGPDVQGIVPTTRTIFLLDRATVAS